MPLHPSVVERVTRLPAESDEVFAWHLRPGALERLTPPWERVEVVRRDPAGIAEGSRIELRMYVGPVPVRWVSVHRGVVPGREFRDEQVEGPFPHWVHLHHVEPDGPGMCRLHERIEFIPPLGALGRLAEGPAVRARLERMLAYRHAVLREDLAAHGRSALARGASRPLHVAVTGAAGLIGSALLPFLTTGGHRVTRLVRRAPRDGMAGADEARWDPEAGTIDREALDGIDAVVHLAGENLMARRWSPEQKRRLRESRTRGTRLLAETLAGLERRPGVLVSASAIGVYGDRGDEVLEETSGFGDGFLAELGAAWEGAAEPAAAAGIRVVHPRMGIVLSPAGGALREMLLPFELGGGAVVSDGRMWWSPVSIDDTVGLIHHAISTPALQGAMNVVAPEPLRNADFTRLLARVLRRPALLRVPAAALRLRFGEVADEVLLASQRVMPRRAEATAYHFRHPTARAALHHVLGRRDATG